jgi:hypothetical protein
MADIDNLDIGIDRKNDAFDGADEVIVDTKVGG